MKKAIWFLGLAALTMTAALPAEAKKRGLGQEIPTSWFLQDIRD